jgi:DNA-directed RNA polymerase specialized sigma24 family protein
MTETADERFDIAARALLDAATGEDVYDREVFDQLTTYLERFVLHRFGGSRIEAEEVVASAIASFIGAVRMGRVERQGAPAYLTTIVNRTAIDQRRRGAGRHEILTDEIPERSADDDIARWLDERASAELIILAMREALRVSDDQSVEIARQWLDLADRTGAPPSSRELAAHLPLSHATINRALGRFRAHLDRAAHVGSAENRSPSRVPGRDSAA